MVGWHHQLNRHKSEQTPGYSEEQGSRACCSPWGHKELDTTKQQNNNNTPFKHLKKQDPCSSTHQQSCVRSLPHEDVGGNPTSSVEWCERRPKCHYPSLPAGIDQRKLSGQSGPSPVPSCNKCHWKATWGEPEVLSPPSRNRRNSPSQWSEESILLPSWQ